MRQRVQYVFFRFSQGLSLAGLNRRSLACFLHSPGSLGAPALSRMRSRRTSREQQGSGPPQVVYLQDPKPYDFVEIVGQPGRAVDLRLELTARVVSFHPLTLDVLNVDGPAQKVFAEQCGFTILSLW